MSHQQQYISERGKLTARARKIGARINREVCEKVTMTDGTVYRVTTQPELDALIDQLEKMHNG
jgi:hypothetical protein